MARTAVLPSAFRTASAPRIKTAIVAQWLAYVFPCQRFAPNLAMRHA